MIWILLAVLSAALLGIYDLLKKKSLDANAVIPVLFFSVLTSVLIFTPIALYAYNTEHNASSIFNFKNITLTAHLLFFIKSIIVGSSWTLAYFAMKNLPLTIVSPIRSSGPLWTLLGALIIFGEHLNLWQWIGLVLTIFFYYLFGLSGLKEGISFRTNKWVMYMTLATIIGSISSLYDKFLVANYNRLAMQAWYHIYMLPLMFMLLMFIWYPNRQKYTLFRWRWTIPLIGVCLTIADFIYFWSLSYPGSLIAIVSTVRRGSVIVSFSLGAIIFKEKNIKQKAFILLGILLGIAIIILGG
jgi:bacterial/archaeal transporter family protein